MHALSARGAPAAIGALPRRQPRTRRAATHCAAAPPPQQPPPQQPPPQLIPAGGASQFVIAGQRRPPEPVLSDGFCFRCRPTAGVVTCPDCGGTGALARGGYTRANPVAVKNLVGSKWTAHETTFGWRHFVVLSRRKEGATQFAEMLSTCDATVRFWVNVANLKDRERWSCGWLEKTEMRAVSEGGSGAPGGRCRACRGEGACRCPACASPGAVQNV